MRDEYAARAYDEYYPHELRRHGKETDGRLNEPHGVGFPLLIAPAFAIGGAKAVELFLAAIAALALALAYRLALRVAPDPWALGAALAAGLSPPLLAYGTAVYPELSAAAALAGAALIAVRLDARVSRWEAGLCFLLLGALAVARHEVRAGGRRDRSLRRALALAGAAPHARGGRGRAVAVLGGALRGDQRGGLRRADAVRGRRRGRDLHGRVLSGRVPGARLPARGAVPGSRLRAAALGAGVRAGLRGPVVAVALASRARRAGGAGGARDRAHCRPAPPRSERSCWWRPFLRLRCSASGSRRGTCWPGPAGRAARGPGFRHAPRVGLALAALTVGASAWLYVDVRWGDGSLAADRPDAPFGPLTDLLPLFTTRGGWPFWLAAAIGVAVAGLVLREARAASPLAPDRGGDAGEVLR